MFCICLPLFVREHKAMTFLRFAVKQFSCAADPAALPTR